MTFPRPAIALLCFAAASACTRETPDLRWIGPLTPQAAGPMCSPTRAALLLRNGNVTFTPDEGTWVLSGLATKDGHLEATRDRLIGSGANAKLYDTRLEATWTEAEVTGTYTTPRCTYAVALKRR